jgi:hypothetical protein
MNSVKTHQPKSLAEITAKYLYDNLPKDCIALITAQHEESAVYLYNGCCIMKSLECIKKYEEGNASCSIIKITLESKVEDMIYVLAEDFPEDDGLSRITFICVNKQNIKKEIARRNIEEKIRVKDCARFLDEEGFFRIF